MSQIEKFMDRQPSKAQIDVHTKAAIKGMAVSNAMVEAAQATYDSWEEYGISDADMRKAIKAALKAYGK